MVANDHNLILDVARDNTNGIPNRPNLGVDCGEMGKISVSLAMK